jgi:hypothetical protein
LTQYKLLEPIFPHNYIRAQSDCPPAIGGLEQRSQLAGIFLRRHNQLSLKLSCSGTQSLDILVRIGMVICIGHFIKNPDPYSLNERAKRSGMTHAAAEQRRFSLGPRKWL